MQNLSLNKHKNSNSFYIYNILNSLHATLLVSNEAQELEDTVNQRTTDNTMTERKRTNVQTMNNKTLHRK